MHFLTHLGCNSMQCQIPIISRTAEGALWGCIDHKAGIGASFYDLHFFCRVCIHSIASCLVQMPISRSGGLDCKRITKRSGVSCIFPPAAVDAASSGTGLRLQRCKTLFSQCIPGYQVEVQAPFLGSKEVWGELHQLMSRSDKESKSSHTTPLTSLYDKQSMNKAEKRIDQSEEEAGLSCTN